MHLKKCNGFVLTVGDVFFAKDKEVLFKKVSRIFSENYSSVNYPEVVNFTKSNRNTNKNMRYSIIGGSDAGISAAFRIKQIDKKAKVDIFLADRFPNFSICGIPFYISKEVTNWQHLAHRTIKEITSIGINIFTNHFVSEIDTTSKRIVINSESFYYDKLLIATGARSVVPKIEGYNLQGVFTLRWIDEMLQLDEYISKNKVEKVLVIGGGYIGLEMADAFTVRGLKVILAEFLPNVLSTVDPVFGEIVKQKLEQKSVEVLTSTAIENIFQQNSRLTVKGSNDFITEVDMVLVAIGAMPENSLAKSINLGLGIKGAIKTNVKMQTSLTDVFAAGDCVETYHALLKQNTYIPLGTTAHKQGRVAGENMAGGSVEFHGSLGSQVVKIFDLVAGRTGLNDSDCEKHNLPHLTVESEFWDHKSYYPGASKLKIRITGNPLTGQLYGAQIIGCAGSEISKRIDIIAAAIHNNYSVEQLNHLDLTYTPPLSSPWDSIQMAAQEWVNKNANN